jgi:hypothetical protein
MMAETIDQMDFNYYGNLSPVKPLAVVKRSYKPVEKISKLSIIMEINLIVK